MSNKRRRSGLAQEELDIQAVLSPSGSSRTLSVGTPAPGQARANAPPVLAPPLPGSLSMESMQQLSSMLSQSLIMALTTAGISGMQIGGPIDAVSQASMQYDEDEDGDEMCDMPTGRPAGVIDEGSVAVPGDVFFGVHANMPEAPLEPNVIVQPLGPVENQAAPVVVLPDADVVLPDATLPVSASDVPPNWHPLTSVLAWANGQIDTSEWVAADREALEKQFTPEREFLHLFEAVPAPPDMLTALKHPTTKENDYLFKRYETENYLYTANKDLVCGLRPLIEVISGLTGIPGQEHNRFLLGQVYQSVASALSHINRGRRELGRRFVPLTNAAALFRKKPTHHCYFGDTSVSNAVQGAVSESKVNKDLVLMPKKRQQPFRLGHPGSKYAGQDYSSASKGRYQSQRGYNYNNKQQKFQNRRGRGNWRNKGSRGKGKSKAKSSTQE